MLVKIVNLTDNRFKNCRSKNFNKQFTSFGNLGTEVIAHKPHMPHLSTARFEDLLSGGKKQVSFSPDDSPKPGQRRVREITEKDLGEDWRDGEIEPGDSQEELVESLKRYQSNRGGGDGYDID